MSLFDQVGRALSSALGGGGSDSSALVGRVLETLGKGAQQDGLSGLVQAFQANGLGKIVEILRVEMDKLTPDGKIPKSGILAQVPNLLKSKPS